MSKGMLGKLPLSAVRGPRDTLDELLAGSDGPIVLDELKKFNRRQTCWLPKERKGSKKKAKPAELVAPDGGRIHVLRVPVNPTREWQEAINAAGPNTPSNYDVRKVADKYPPQDGVVEEKEIILVNFGKTISDTRVAVEWGKQHGLRPASPRPVFAIGEHKPQLHRELGVNAMAVVSPEECSFDVVRRVCIVWWSDADRHCNLRWFGHEWSAYYWFAFVRE